MIKYYKKSIALLLILTLLRSLSLAQDTKEVEVHLDANATQALLFCEASQTVLLSKAELSETRTLSLENLDAARTHIQKLERAAFELLTQEQRITFKNLAKHSNNLDPQILKCSRILSEQAYTDIYSGIGQLILAGTLYLSGYTNAAIVIALIPSEFFISDNFRQLMHCKAVWREHNYSLANAEWIRIQMDKIIGTSFFDLVVLKMKYDDLANLPWASSHSWNAKEWEKVNVIFQKMDMLLDNIYQSLSGHNWQNEDPCELAAL